MKLPVLGLTVLLIVTPLAGCTYNQTGGEPLPSMTFTHVEPFMLNVGSIKIVNKYERGQSTDASGEMPTPPDLALRRYVQNRLRAAGAPDKTLYFVIEDAYVSKTVIEPSNKFVRWTGVNDSDKYDMNVVVRMYSQNVNGRQSDHSVMTFNRSITIPHHYSLAEKELEKLKFMEHFMQDVDTSVRNALNNQEWYLKESSD